MELQCITPLVLTYNEEANLARTLERLDWAERVVVVDSGSTDATRKILARYPQVDVFERAFDHFAGQCNYGLEQIDTEWVLSLDADYMLSDAFVNTLKRLPGNPTVNGYSTPFTYCIFGRPLRGTLYPPRTVLYRKTRAFYTKDGHAHRVQVEGKTQHLKAPIYHDDRKPLRAWLDAQRRYAEAEAEKLRRTPPVELGMADRLRAWYLAPLFTPLYCLLGKGLILDGAAGGYYTLQRTYAEVLLALRLLDDALRSEADA